MTILKNFPLRILQVLIFFFPISFIFGNFFINSITILISLIGIVHYNKNLLNWSDKISLYLVTSFFAIVIFSSYYQILQNGVNKDSIKSLYFFKILHFAYYFKNNDNSK